MQIDLPREGALATQLATVRAAFEAEHKRSYGHLLDGAIQVVNLRVLGAVAPQTPNRMLLDERTPPADGTRRPVYFGADLGLHDTPVLSRHALTSEPVNGPAVIEEYEGTTIVPPDATVFRDSFDNIVIDFIREARA